MNLKVKLEAMKNIHYDDVNANLDGTNRTSLEEL